MASGVLANTAVGGSIDLRQATAEDVWVALQRLLLFSNLTTTLTQTVTRDGNVLGIGVSHNPLRRRQIASQTQGATVVEPVDLQAANALKCLVAFAAEVITRVSPATLQPRLESLRRGTARNPTTEAEAALVAFANAPSFPLATEAR